MKHFKILFFLIFFQSVSSADIIDNVVLFNSKNICIYNDYYLKSGKLHYHKVKNDTWYYTSTKNYPFKFQDNFIFDTSVNECYKNPDADLKKYTDTALGFSVAFLLIWSLI